MTGTIDDVVIEDSAVQGLEADRGLVSRKSTTERVAGVLRKRIAEGFFLPGGRLSEQDIGNALGVSRNTLREAFRLLTHERLLAHELNRGVFVRIPSIEDVVDIYRVRKIIECAAVRGVTAKPATFPRIKEKVDIGDSWCKSHPGSCVLPSPWNGYDLFVLHITNRNIPGPKPVFWADGDIHAREIATPEVVMRMIDYLLNNYNTDADAHWLVDYHDIWLMPEVNPDGHHIVEAGGGAWKYWRRT